VAEIVVRLVRVDDAEVIARMWEALVSYHRELDPDLPPAAPNGARRYARRIVDRLADPFTRALIAEIDGQPVGYILGVVADFTPEIFDQEPSGFLADIYVDEQHRRSGVGKALVDQLAAWFVSRGLAYFEWHVAARNPAGVAFWQAVGGRSVMIRMRADLDSYDSERTPSDDPTTLSDQ